MTIPHSNYPPPLSIGRPLISIILPCFNAAPYLQACIESVLDQSWDRWELLIVDNGSTDGSRDIAARYIDPRIILLDEPQRGVSRARNKALSQMNGDYFCFLDADDILPRHSLRLRLDLFRRHPEVSFADGAMADFDTSTGKVIQVRTPWYHGEPFDALMRMNGSAFAGNTWMVKRLPDFTYRFPEHMAHSEDHAFFLSISRQGKYVSTPRVVLQYRKGHTSAYSDPLKGHPGYLKLYSWMQDLDPSPSDPQLKHAWKRIRRIIFRDLVKRGRFTSAVKAWMRQRPE